jgi:hypothetical protein
MVLAAGLVRILEERLGCRMTGTEFQSRTLILTCDPAAGYFLFDTAFPQGSKSKATQFCLRLFRPDSKRMPSKIRYARPVACQGAPRRPGPALRFCPRRTRRPPAPYKALRVPELHPYGQPFLLSMERFSRQEPTAHSRPPDRKAELRINAMLKFQPESLLLIPFGLGVFFMLWVLWNLWLDEHRKP